MILGPKASSCGDSIVDSLGDLLVTADGGLAGPFNAFVTAPGAGRRLPSLGATLRPGGGCSQRHPHLSPGFVRSMRHNDHQDLRSYRG